MWREIWQQIYPEVYTFITLMSVILIWLALK